jgi:DNA-binding transcriptional MerR regulator/methylmalonyl-CoA mutase cobalamin-binding subunit
MASQHDAGSQHSGPAETPSDSGRPSEQQPDSDSNRSTAEFRRTDEAAPREWTLPDGSRTSLHSIGEVAEASGISPDTLRVWERRYGRPEPVRLPSGHRRYTGEQLRWLRRIAEAMALGIRPQAALRVGDEELDRLIRENSSVKELSPEVAALIELVREFRGDSMTERLLNDWHRLGARGFIDQRVAPLLVHIGRGWADGKLDVRHEHFASEILTDLLRSLRAGIASSSEGPVVLFATLRNEQHGLGLQMAALVASLRGATARILGTDTPIEEVALAAQELGARAVAISVSLAQGGVETDRSLSELRRRLPPDIALVVGGGGARGIRRGPRGVDFVDDFAAFERWLEPLLEA